MTKDAHITLTPEPGTKLLYCKGDTITFTLATTSPLQGSAFLRTNLGQASIIREQIIASVEKNIPGLGLDWFDIQMSPCGSQQYRLRLPLNEVGHFEAKALFVPRDSSDPIWIPGPNISVNVEPAQTACANIIYNAFVRQFGPNKSGQFHDGESTGTVKKLDQAGYIVIPPSGSFRDLIRELDFIIGDLGCRFVQLLPIHPTPTTYARMGRFGSPYAALSFTAVDPALAEFDEKATPLEQFIELVDAIHARNAKLLMDIAINHTGWAASIHETHPEWLVRDSSGDIQVPGAWGVRWEDLTKLNYEHQSLWQYMADVFLTWCQRGVDGFRCDAGYMIPTQVWRYIISMVREQFPDTIFFLEGLGGKTSVTRELLGTANFNWAYSELFQNYNRQDVIHQLQLAEKISESQGTMAHYAETHDNLRLAARSQTWSKMRTALCALTSYRGTYGFANGVEWFATDKINVHESPSLNWGAAENQVAHIQRLNQLLKHHPAFYHGASLMIITHESEEILVLLRENRSKEKKLLILINLDDSRPRRAVWPTLNDFNPQQPWKDLLGDEVVTPVEKGELSVIDLLPGQAMCITTDENEGLGLHEPLETPFKAPTRIVEQMLRSKVLDIWEAFHGFGDLGDFDLQKAVLMLQQDPVAFCREMNNKSSEPRIIKWVWPRDRRREVMLPPGFLLLVECPHAFHVRLTQQRKVLIKEQSLSSANGDHWALLKPVPVQKENKALSLQLSVFADQGCQHSETPLLLLSDQLSTLDIHYSRQSLKTQTSYLRTIQSNDFGSVSLLPVVWGQLHSRYDAVLSANLDSDVPMNRWIMLTRVRGWIVYQDYSQALDENSLEAFGIDESQQGQWTFRVPTGHGTHVVIRIKIVLETDRDDLQIVLERGRSGTESGRLIDSEPIDVILRPDIENRSFHELSKAYTGLEENWPDTLISREDGFTFQPDEEHILDLNLPGGQYISEPEWLYMVKREEDETRGFDPDGDLFSPGYFKTQVRGGESIHLKTLMNRSPKTNNSVFKITPYDSRFNQEGDHESTFPIQTLLESALRQFIVRRDSLKTIIAGYPWFLDWGRDAIIVTRALIAMGETKLARRVLSLFGRFEENGTLPNMLEGSRTSNRDTSDAPLWFIVAASDLVAKEKDSSWLEEPCGARTIRDILKSIMNAYVNGTDNGIKMDPESGLIYSPSHFTWMDTNHPAGTPREGYPIEIQSLWYSALLFFEHMDDQPDHWSDLTQRVHDSISDYFWLESEQHLADCLYAGKDTPASQAETDNALRPNQLLAVTMGALDDPEKCWKLMEACQELLIPGAIRSLADRPLNRPLKIVHNGETLGDPLHPYKGRYIGDEDTSRKPAYHNGTAWSWMFPTFCEAWVQAFGPASRTSAQAWLNSISVLLKQGCIGHIPEILDGDFPHRQRGCPAQAWGVSETLRVLILLNQGLN